MSASRVRSVAWTFPGWKAEVEAAVRCLLSYIHCHECNLMFLYLSKWYHRFFLRLRTKLRCFFHSRGCSVFSLSAEADGSFLFFPFNVLFYYLAKYKCHDDVSFYFALNPILLVFIGLLKYWGCCTISFSIIMHLPNDWLFGVLCSRM